MLHVKQHLTVHLSHARPITSVHVLHVKVVALVAPTFVEDLFEFFFWIEVHPQRKVQTSLALLRWAIRIDQEQLRRRRSTETTTATTKTATTTCGSIQKLPTICAHLVSRNRGHE